MSFFDTLQKSMVVQQKIDMAVSAVFFLFFLFFLLLARLPWYYPLGLLVFFLLLEGLLYVRIKDIEKADLSAKPIPEKPMMSADQISNDRVVAAFYGMWSTRQYSAPLLRGVAKVHNPENAIMITDKRVLFVAVPMEGGGLLVSGTNMTFMQNIFNRGKIQERGARMIASMSPRQILEFNPEINYCLDFGQLSEVKISTSLQRVVRFKTFDGKEVSYYVPDKADLLKMKEVLSYYLPGKVR